jgi:uncharacterized protein YbjQ (UPF0145 family)
VIDLAAALSALSAPAHGGEMASIHGPGGRAATSDLSIDETLLLHSIGWEPVDLVFGISWWSIPWSTWTWRTGEIDEASTAFSGAMAEAADQMREECARVGGNGVIGVDVDLRVTSSHVDVSLSGTAVRRSRPEGPTRSGGSGEVGFEFLSDLSARDFVLLTRSGWWPLGLVSGASFVAAPRRSARQWASQQTQNVELPNLTNALYQAREGAMDRMQQAGAVLQAEGVVEVKLREGPLGHGMRVMQFVALGTAVHLREGAHRRVTPAMAVCLDDVVNLFDARSLREAKRGGAGRTS